MEKVRRILTLVIVQQGERVLLGMKKRGFGEGRWNGFGGKVEEADNSIEDAAKREVVEEIGIEVGDLIEVGILDFNWQNDSKALRVHVFRATEFQGEPVETEEMRPKWFSRDEIPYNEMWSDDRYWFGRFLDDRPFSGWFLFDVDDQVVDQKLEDWERAK